MWAIVCALKSNQKITFSLIQCFVFTPSLPLLPSGQSRMDQFSEGFVLKNINTNKKHRGKRWGFITPKAWHGFNCEKHINFVGVI